jgi:Zn-dependent M16 (insulinase) family peptidase
MVKVNIEIVTTDNRGLIKQRMNLSSQEFVQLKEKIDLMTMAQPAQPNKIPSIKIDDLIDEIQETKEEANELKFIKGVLFGGLNGDDD